MLTADRFEDFDSQSFGFLFFASRFLVRFGGTTDAIIYTTSLRNSRTNCWPSDVLDS